MQSGPRRFSLHRIVPLCHSEPPKFLTRQGYVYLHPSSCNFKTKRFPTKFMCYFEKVKTSKVFIRDSSSVSPYPLLLFGGGVDVQHADSTITMDGWVTFNADRKVAVLVKLLRRELDDLLRLKIMVGVRNGERHGVCGGDSWCLWFGLVVFCSCVFLYSLRKMTCLCTAKNLLTPCATCCTRKVRTPSATASRRSPLVN